MKFEIIDSEVESFKVYAGTLYFIYTKNYKWLRENSRAIPAKIKKKIKGRGEKEIFNFNNIRKIHRKIHVGRKSVRKKLSLELTKIINDLGAYITHQIAKETGLNWKTNKIKIVIAAYRGATVRNSNTIIGYLKGPYRKGRLIRLIIHELIHLNTLPYLSPKLKKPSITTDINEVVTVLLTNKIIKNINNEFKTKFLYQKFHLPLSKKDRLNIQTHVEKSMFFFILFRNIKKYLVGKRYKSFYKLRT